MSKSKHVGMWLNVDREPVHMLGDPAMSNETAEALAELVRAAKKMIDDNPKFICLCVRCGENKTGAPDGVCTQCKIDDLWKM